MASVEERIKTVTGRVLKIDPARIKPGDSFAADLGAESVQSIELVANFEHEFGIEMDEDAALSVTTVGDAAKFIAEYDGNGINLGASACVGYSGSPMVVMLGITRSNDVPSHHLWTLSVGQALGVGVEKSD